MVILIISVISPTRRGGCSTVSTLVAGTLAASLTVPVTLTHTGIKDMGMSLYLDLSRNYDITNSLDQLYTLIKQGALSEGGLSDYTVNKTEYLHVLEPNSTGMTDAKSTRILSYLMSTLKDELSVIDITTELAEDATQETIKKSDYIICVLDANILTFKKLQDWREEAWGEFLNKNNVMYLFNNYNPNVCELKRLSTLINVKHRNTWKLNYNPLIQKYCNNGELDKIVQHIQAGYEPLIDVGIDLDNIADVVVNQLALLGRGKRRRISNVK